MSEGFTMISHTIMHNEKLPIGLRGFLVLIRSYGQGKFAKNCFPGIETLAEKAGCSARQATRNVRMLEKAGVLKVVRKRGRSNQYFFPDTPDTDVGTQPPTRTSPSTDNGVQKPQTYASVYQYPNKNYKQKRPRLFFGNDPCKVLPEGEIIIFIPHQNRWATYGGNDDDRFRYGELFGAEARRAAIKDSQA